MLLNSWSRTEPRKFFSLISGKANMKTQSTIAAPPCFDSFDLLKAEHKAFFSANGYLHFKKFLSPATVAAIISEVAAIEKKWIAEGVDCVNGIPLKFGKNERGEKMISRFAFLSQYSHLLRDIIRDERIASLAELLNPHKGRIAENEKDGLVFNHYINTNGSGFSRMGWHTDSPRDLFLGQRIMPMLNIGLHLDDCKCADGGLRVLPGTHRQGLVKLLFGKKYFVDNRPDQREVGFDIEAGDLTMHHGSIWHRVQQSVKNGAESRRRVMYIPMITGKYQPKQANSSTPLYHLLTRKIK